MIKAPYKAELEREIIPAGTHKARIYSLVELGTLTSEWQGKPIVAKKIWITWEFPELLKVFKKELGEQPMVTGKEYTLSLAPKSRLLPVVEGVEGKTLSEDEINAYELNSLVGKECFVSIIHAVSKKGNKYADISSVSVPMAGVEIPPAINPPVVKEYSTMTEEDFDKLPKFLREKMETTPEFQVWSERIGYTKKLNDQKWSDMDKIDYPQEENNLDNIPF